MTFSSLKALVFGLAFPRRFSPSLLPLKEHGLKQGLTEIQRYIPRFQEANVDIVDGTYDIMVSGASVFDAPDGEIKQLVVGGDGCATTHAVLSSYLHLQKMQAAFANSFDCYDPYIKPAYPTSKIYWARDDSDLMVYPWVPAGFSIGIRWKGIKRDWVDASDIWWADNGRISELLRRYLVAWDKEGCPEFSDHLTMFREELAILKFEQFRIDNPTSYDPYAVDILFPSLCGSSNGNTETTTAGAT